MSCLVESELIFDINSHDNWLWSNLFIRNCTKYAIKEVIIFGDDNKV